MQGYADAEWAPVVSLWELYNLHLATVIARIPASHAEIPCTIGHNPPQPLADIAREYIDHAVHHMGQILEPAAL